ncbi:hypothetical protein JHW43_000954 [Diplocarpon mali]|nr:hypothetical protein JHW43_000954 [Diplocarpon mali]
MRRAPPNTSRPSARMDVFFFGNASGLKSPDSDPLIILPRSEIWNERGGAAALSACRACSRLPRTWLRALRPGPPCDGSLDREISGFYVASHVPGPRLLASGGRFSASAGTAVVR